MQIALTKKLANAIDVKPSAASKAADPIFCWTANWTSAFANRKEDILVMVNHATRFTVAVYGVKRDNLTNIAQRIQDAIRNTLAVIYVDPQVIEEYMQKAGEIEFVPNTDRKVTAWVNRQGMEVAVLVAHNIYGRAGDIKYDDTLGSKISNNCVNSGSGDSKDRFVPKKKMVDALETMTGKPAYKYDAFELLITLDLEIYKAVRRIIVPADIGFYELHEVLQTVFSWHNCHMFDFCVFEKNNIRPIAVLVGSKEELDYIDNSVLMGECKLSDFFPVNELIVYTYDMGDSWKHEIKLVRQLPNHNEESPYRLEAIGQTPPEDVGGVGGFIEFREIMLDPNHPDYEETKNWVGYWAPDLQHCEVTPRVI